MQGSREIRATEGHPLWRAPAPRAVHAAIWFWEGLDEPRTGAGPSAALDGRAAFEFLGVRACPAMLLSTCRGGGDRNPTLAQSASGRSASTDTSAWSSAKRLTKCHCPSSAERRALSTMRRSPVRSISTGRICSMPSSIWSMRCVPNAPVTRMAAMSLEAISIWPS